MKVLIGCEESQTVCKAFRALGHEAYSCDTMPCSGGHPEWHIKDKLQHVLTRTYSVTESVSSSGFVWHPVWDLAIFHPPCDHLAVSGARWFCEKREGSRQRAAIEFFLMCWNASIEHIVIENPIGIMSGSLGYLKEYYPDLYGRATLLPKPQIIQPWQFGHGETKATCLWLKNLPKLVPTNVVDGREQRIFKMAPGPNRARGGARTYIGIAEAMAEQFGAI